MDNCKYIAISSTYIFKIEGTQSFYVYLRQCYLYNLSSMYLAYIASGYPDIMFDILGCRINLSRSDLLNHTNGYQIRAEIYSASSFYEPRIINTIPVLTLFSPTNETDLYLSTPKGMEKIIKMLILASKNGVFVGCCAPQHQKCE